MPVQPERKAFNCSSVHTKTEEFEVQQGDQVHERVLQKQQISEAGALSRFRKFECSDALVCEALLIGSVH